MSIITVSCRCGATIQAPGSYAGRRGKCKKCGASVALVEGEGATEEIPFMAIEGYVQSSKSAPVPPPVATTGAAHAPAPAPVRPPAVISPEPGYYRFLGGCAWAVIV